MKGKGALCMAFACMVLISGFEPRAEAVSAEPDVVEIVERSSGQYRMNMSANMLSLADSDFFLEAEETVSIRASYSPKSASVDFGLIAPDGLFYSSNTENGSISVTFSIGQRGYYTLAVRNNSSNEISVSGYVNY